MSPICQIFIFTLLGFAVIACEPTRTRSQAPAVRTIYLPNGRIIQVGKDQSVDVVTRPQSWTPQVEAKAQSCVRSICEPEPLIVMNHEGEVMMLTEAEHSQNRLLLP